MLLHKDGKQVKVPEIDAPGWLRAGWSDTPEGDYSAPIADSASDRLDELMAIYEEEGWRAIKRIADDLGIDKPEGGWDEAIALIVDAEYG